MKSILTTLLNFMFYNFVLTENKTYLTLHGTAIDIRDAPYVAVVLIEVMGRQSYCSGTFIHERWVLTARHCFLNRINPDKAYVQYGVDDVMITSNEIAVENWILQTGNKDTHDLALLNLSQPLPITETSKVIKIEDTTWQFNYRICFAVGFGLNANFDFLLRGSTFIVRQSTRPCGCGEGSTALLCAYVLHDSPCFGDSGGPLVYENNRLVGVIAFGKLCPANNFRNIERRYAAAIQKCSKFDVAVFISLCYHMKWISTYVPGLNEECTDIKERLSGDTACKFPSNFFYVTIHVIYGIFYSLLY